MRNSQTTSGCKNCGKTAQQCCETCVSEELETNMTLVGPADFTNVISVPIETTAGDVLKIDSSFSVRISTPTPGVSALGTMRLAIDGVAVPFSNAGIYKPIGDTVNVEVGSILRRIEGLAPGLHLVSLQWSAPAGATMAFVVTGPGATDHASLVVCKSPAAA